VSRIGEKIGETIPRGTVSTWKTRGSLPRPETLKKIADYFDVTIDWLTNDSQDFSFDPEAADPMNEKLKELWSKMTVLQRAELLIKAVEILG
jgi:transcriptional regulator with XRE-family HTH domain